MNYFYFFLHLFDIQIRINRLSKTQLARSTQQPYRQSTITWVRFQYRAMSSSNFVVRSLAQPLDRQANRQISRCVCEYKETRRVGGQQETRRQTVSRSKLFTPKITIPLFLYARPQKFCVPFQLDTYSFHMQNIVGVPILCCGSSYSKFFPNFTSYHT